MKEERRDEKRREEKRRGEKDRERLKNWKPMKGTTGDGEPEPGRKGQRGGGAQLGGLSPKWINRLRRSSCSHAMCNLANYSSDCASILQPLNSSKTKPESGWR
jgi:hypothetical protein